MDHLLEKKRSISFSDESSSTFNSSRSRKSSSPAPLVKFLPTVQVAMLPWQEREEARKARSGNWKPAPMSDELWDGEFMCFREVELTPEEFKAILNGGKRRKNPMPLKAFARMFSLATSSQQSTESDKEQQHTRLEGVDIVHARARVYAEDFDEEERDSNGRLGSTESNSNNTNTTGMVTLSEDEPTHVVMKLSCEQIGDEIVLTFQPDFEASKSPPPPPPPQNKKRPTEDRTTKFLPSPPPGPSPSELALGLLSGENQEIRTKISNSNVPFFTGPQFVCGDGKRPLFYMGEQPLLDEHEWIDPSTTKADSSINQKSGQKKRSIFGSMFSGMFSSSPRTVILT